MPELPEVETTRCGIEPHLVEQIIGDVIIRNRQLRVPITAGLSRKLVGQSIEKVDRRGKYLLLNLEKGCLLCHLGMSGSLRIIRSSVQAAKHDHLDIVLRNGMALRLNDPRRFGIVLWVSGNPLCHKLLRDLGPEPLGEDFTADYLYRMSRTRLVAVKNFIMDSKIVVGIGNIYANEALFGAGIHPLRMAGRVSQARYQKLVVAIQKTLKAAIKSGGTTLRNFVREDGRPGYFSQQLLVYHRQSEPCVVCGTPIRKQVIGQRTSFYCPNCQH